MQLLHHDGLDWVAGESWPVGAHGEVPPFQSEFPVGTRLRVTLTGESLARTFADLPAGEAGESAQVRISIEEGSTLLLSAVDAEFNVIMDSFFRLEWGVGQDSLRVELASDKSGIATIPGVPPGRVVPYVGAPGWATNKYRALRVPRDANRLRSLILTPAGRLDGRCLRDGQPVSEFTVTTWWFSDSTTSVERVFRDRHDGTFAIDDIPLGWSRVVASVPGGERSALTKVWVSTDEEEMESVDLAISSGVGGKGEVVTAKEGAPIEGALVRTWVSDSEQPVAPSACEVRTNRTGSFEFPPVLYENTMVSVEALGFAKAWAPPTTAPDGSLSFGRVVLHAAQTAHVVIESSAPLPMHTYYASIKGSDIEELHPFPPGGSIELNGLSMGYREIDFFRIPTLLMTVGKRLAPTQDWTFRIPAFESRSLELHLLGGPVVAPSQEWSIHLKGSGLDGETYTLWRGFDSDRTARVAPIPDGDFSFWVNDEDGDAIYRSTFSVGPDDGDLVLTAEIPRTRTHIHLINEAGEPLGGATIVVQPDSMDPEALVGTDDDGRGTLTGLTAGPASITVWHDAGTESGIPAEILADEDTHIELLLSEQRSVTVRATVGGAPASGLSFDLRTRPANYLIDSRRTDTDGIAEFPRCGSGRYYVATMGNDTIWPKWQYIQANNGEPIEVMLHRRGALHLEFLDETDAPLANIEFLIYHEELEYALVESVGGGLWQSSTGELRTDAAGEVLLTGIPEGQYRVFLPGAAKSWKMSVSPGEAAFEKLRPHPQ